MPSLKSPNSPALADLDSQQRAAATSDAAPLLLLAGPGSGKTEVLAQRVMWRCDNDPEFDPRRALIATFTRHAAQELWTRLAGAGIHKVGSVGTIHSAALRQIRQYEQSRDIKPARVLAHNRDLINELLTDRRGNRGYPMSADGFAARGGAAVSGNSEPTASQICAEIDWAVARNITPEQYGDEAGSQRIGARRAGTVASMFKRFVKVKADRNLIDFNDVLARCRQLIESDREFSAQMHWSYRHFFVDEFQDVTPLQFGLLTAWLGGRSDLFCVGDPNQSIYGWNGADPRYLIDFEEYFPGATTLRLNLNRRSTPQVVKAAEAVFGGGDSAQIAGRPDGVVPTFLGWGNEAAEAEGITSLLRSKMAGTPKNSWAVLARTHAYLRRIARALDKAGIACKLAGVRSLIDRSDAVQLRKELASLAANRFEAAVRDLVLEAVDPISELSESSESDSDAPELEQEPPPEPTHSRGYDRVLELAQQYIRDFGYGANKDDLSGMGFDAWLAGLTPYDIDPATSRSGVVSLATFHAAKGLQWGNVIVAGASKGIVPTKQGDPEERRLLYVAMTRAIEGLYLTWDEERGRCEWLDEIEAASTPPPPASDQEWREGIEKTRATIDALNEAAAGMADQLAKPSEAQARRRELLERWRTTSARARQVEELAVMDDKVLAVIAKNGLGTLAALVKATGLSAVRLARLHESVTEQLPEVLIGAGGVDVDGDPSADPEQNQLRLQV